MSTGRLENQENKKENKLMKFMAGNIEVSLSPSIVKKYLVNGQGNVTDQEIMYFMHLCKANQLNPFIREPTFKQYTKIPHK